LHIWEDSQIGMSCTLADETHEQNAVAIEDIVGSKAILNPSTGQVCNVEKGEDE
ncbi:hypothetical protein LCGC14_2618190, partial [marine sediment metagenome]